MRGRFHDFFADFWIIFGWFWGWFWDDFWMIFGWFWAAFFCVFLRFLAFFVFFLFFAFFFLLCYTQRVICFLCCIFSLFYSSYATCRDHPAFCVVFSCSFAPPMLHTESNLLPVLHFPALLLRLCYTQRLFCFLCCIFLLFYSAYATHRDCSAYCVAFPCSFAPPMLHTETVLFTVLHFPALLLRLCNT